MKKFKLIALGIVSVILVFASLAVTRETVIITVNSDRSYVSLGLPFTFVNQNQGSWDPPIGWHWRVHLYSPWENPTHLHWLPFILNVAIVFAGLWIMVLVIQKILKSKPMRSKE